MTSGQPAKQSRFERFQAQLRAENGTPEQRAKALAEKIGRVNKTTGRSLYSWKVKNALYAPPEKEVEKIDGIPI